MAHWAELDENNIVLRVLVTDNNDPNGDEGYKWLVDNLGGTWVKTSYNTRAGIHYTDGIPSDDQTKALRGNYAGVGFSYDPILDAFLPPKPFDSWIVNEATYQWKAPIDYPDDGLNYQWDESIVNWELVETEEN